MIKMSDLEFEFAIKDYLFSQKSEYVDLIESCSIILDSHYDYDGENSSESCETLYFLKICGVGFEAAFLKGYKKYIDLTAGRRSYCYDDIMDDCKDDDPDIRYLSFAKWLLSHRSDIMAFIGFCPIVNG